MNQGNGGQAPRMIRIVHRGNGVGIPIPIPVGNQPIRVRINNNQARPMQGREGQSITLYPIDEQKEKLVIAHRNNPRSCNTCFTKTANNLASFCPICGSPLPKAKTTKRSPLVWKYQMKFQVDTDKPLHWSTSETYLLETDVSSYVIKKRAQEIMALSLEGKFLWHIEMGPNQPVFLVYPRNGSSMLLYLSGFGFRELNPSTGELLREVPTNASGVLSHTKNRIYLRSGTHVQCYHKESLEQICNLPVNPVVLFISGYNGDYLYFFINRPQLTLHRCERIEELVNVNWGAQQLPFRAITSFQGAERCSIISSDKEDVLIVYGGSYIKRIHAESGEMMWGYSAHSVFPDISRPLFHLNRSLLIVQSTIIQYTLSTGEFSHQPLCLENVFPKGSKVRGASSSSGNLIVSTEDSLHLFTSEIMSLHDFCVRVVVQNLSRFYDKLHYFSTCPATVSAITKELKYQQQWTPAMNSLFFPLDLD